MATPSRASDTQRIPVVRIKTRDPIDARADRGENAESRLTSGLERAEPRPSQLSSLRIQPACRLRGGTGAVEREHALCVCFYNEKGAGREGGLQTPRRDATPLAALRNPNRGRVTEDRSPVECQQKWA